MNTRTTGPTVLISGAGVAGTTLAYWLARHGFRPTIVELATGLRSSGNPVDVRGPAVEVAERMGVLPRLRDAATEVTALSFVNTAGRPVGRINMRALQRASRSGEVELTRTDLARILFEASRDSTEILFGDTAIAFHQDAGGVDVTFAHSAPRRFDLVIGADGLHSTTRRLAFGPEAGFVRHMGLYIATVPLDGPADSRTDVVIHNAPGRMAALHPVHDRAVAAFVFRHPGVTDFDPRDTEQHRRVLAGSYTGGGWRVPELLDRALTAEDLWLDSVSRVRIASWADGRIALLGDAASSVSLFGDGSTLAVAGAHTLAEELAATPADHRAAFARYEAKHRELVDPRQNNVGAAAALMVPATRAAIAARNAATRLWPAVAAGAWLRDRARPRPAHRAPAPPRVDTDRA
ncbi:FAD-dependent monooxygenase [Kitasatospora purpeofusca]|uniref:FAD-dependent monooxygenase n=1 Tax=Kitasatospora purpeofusca TaxID=67352 RepID=UPI002E0DA443|nr:FAD-dependent monooxygenase [Kitasatospora purpeofusca]WSR43468.1 FAD-dependent monooxygenase [Kitasatospora purpeofusca]